MSGRKMEQTTSHLSLPSSGGKRMVLCLVRAAAESQGQSGGRINIVLTPRAFVLSGRRGSAQGLINSADRAPLMIHKARRPLSL